MRGILLLRLAPFFSCVLFPLTALAQGFSFCDDLKDIADAAPRQFHGVGTDAMPGAEKCGLETTGRNPSLYRCTWKLSMGDEKSGTIWFAKRIESCFPQWKYEPDYNDAKGPRAAFDSGKAEVKVTSLAGGEVAVTIIPKAE